MAISIMLFAVSVINWVARRKFSITVSTIEKTLRIVAVFVAHTIHEHLPAFGRGAIAPRINTQ